MAWEIDGQEAARAVLLIHGGAGALQRDTINAAEAGRYRDALRDILLVGQRQLADGAEALAVVVEAVRRLEECELFNAGRGAVYTADGTHELDASVMDGRSLQAGAVAGLRRTRNPVLAALAVMQHSEHLLFIGEAADRLAAAHGLEQVEPAWFGTPARLAQLKRAQAVARGVLLDHDAQSLSFTSMRGQAEREAPLDEQQKFGTVGAVALDRSGHLAAATSTGGMTNKQGGRVGDSPVIGAGCYANDATVAVSCTGTGEAFMRVCAAHEVSALVEYAGLSVDEAARRVVMDTLPRIGGRGGLIAVDRRGRISLPFNTEGMYRGVARPGEAVKVAIYADE